MIKHPATGDRIHMVEVQSPSQSPESQKAKLAAMRDALPENQRGSVAVVTPAQVATKGGALSVVRGLLGRSVSVLTAIIGFKTVVEGWSGAQGAEAKATLIERGLGLDVFYLPGTGSSFGAPPPTCGTGGSCEL
jgi:hypothetical protein